MKPHITCHMVSSIDGRILMSRWRPSGKAAGDLFETLHDEIGCDAWIVGRVTGQEFAKRDEPYPQVSETFPRENHFAVREADAFGVVVDAHGKVAFGRADIGGDPIVVVLTRKVSDSHLAGLRADGLSYIFAGDDEVDLAAAVETLNRELKIERILVEGGGGLNGSFLRAGLLDAISLVVCPAVDGAKGAPSVFDSGEEMEGPTAAVGALTLTETKVLDGGAVWLRYEVGKA